MSKPTILIVEDEAVTAMALKKSLTDMDYDVCGVEPTGEVAIKKAGELNPDIILMDIYLAGDMSGIEAAENIRLRYQIPVIYLTAFSDEKHIQKARITAPYGYILKPVRERELKTTIEMALSRKILEQELGESYETIRVLLNATSDMHYLMDANGKYLVVSESLAKKVGKTPKQLVGTQVFDTVASGMLSPRMACYNRSPIEREKIQFEELFNERWYTIEIQPISNGKGAIAKYAVHIHDITRIKNIEEQLHKNEEYFRLLIETSSDVIIVLNPDGTFRNDSISFDHAAGFAEKQSSAGLKIFDLLQKDHVNAARQIFNEVLNTPYMMKPLFLVFKTKNGGKITLDGIISNMNENPIIQGILLYGWLV
ncbi:MAG: response regulator [Methanoregula sp.]